MDSAPPPNFIANDEIVDYWTYLKSIDWYDPWLICLILAHIATTATAIMTKHHGNFQIFFFFILLVIVYFSEDINEIAAKNWQSFSKQQYFDSNGLFISTVFSIPILLNCMLMIGNWLYSSTQLMAKVKTEQLKSMHRRERNQRQKTE